MKPMFFVDNKEVEVNIFVLYNKNDSSIIRVAGTAIDEDLIDGIVQEQYKFYFSKPNYDDISKYRQLSMYYDDSAKKTIVNPFKLRNYIILNHLKHWDGITDVDGNIINLELDIDGTLKQSSLDLVYQMNPSVVDVVMTIFEQKAMLS